MKIKLINRDKGLSPPSTAFDFRPNRTVDSNPKLDNMKGDYVSPKNRKKRKYYIGGEFTKYKLDYTPLNTSNPTPDISELRRSALDLPIVPTQQQEETQNDPPVYSLTWTENTTASDLPESLEELLKQEGFDFRVTSKLRPGAMTKRGTPSNHSKGTEDNPGAYDIVPTNGDFVAFRSALYNNPRVVQWLRNRGWGILEETSPTVMQQTGASGPHFHFGPDPGALRMSEQAYREFRV